MLRMTIATSRCPALLSQKTAELAAKAKAENDLAKAAKEDGRELEDQRPGGPDAGRCRNWVRWGR